MVKCHAEYDLKIPFGLVNLISKLTVNDTDSDFQ